MNQAESQNQSRPNRHIVCDIIRSRLTDTFLTIGVKELGPLEMLMNSTDSVLYMTSEIGNTQTFLTDRLVSPYENIPFNPQSDQYPLSQRNLTRYPDVMQVETSRRLNY